jgi:hypothetical protein
MPKMAAYRRRQDEKRASPITSSTTYQVILRDVDGSPVFASFAIESISRAAKLAKALLFQPPQSLAAVIVVDAVVINAQTGADVECISR